MSEEVIERSPARTNPFDRELLMADEHFTTTLLDRATASGNGSLAPSATDTVLTRIEELTLAIEQCKEMIIDQMNNRSEKSRRLVAKLVQMRLEVQQLKDGEKDVTDADKAIGGHDFQLKGSSGRNPYCECCLTSIWRMIQIWYRCKACGYRVHAKCLPMVKRVCGAVRARELLKGYQLDICPEKGLAAQNYRCAECKVQIGFTQNTGEARQCDYTGLFYCSGCHWNDLIVIPARVVHNWDFEPRKVCRACKQLLCVVESKPLLHLEQANYQLFNYLQDLRSIRKYRRDIMLMKCYFVCCKQARNLRILLHLNKHMHFVEGSELYSLNDLRAVQCGHLLDDIRQIMDIFVAHIKQECETCQGNGFICELCSDTSIIFPFDDSVAVCRQCCAVFHRQCFEAKLGRCSRCRRRQRRSQLTDCQSETPTVNNTEQHGVQPCQNAEEMEKSPFFKDDTYDQTLNPFHE